LGQKKNELHLETWWDNNGNTDDVVYRDVMGSGTWIPESPG